MRDTLLLHVIGWSLFAAVPAQAGPVLVDPTRPAGFTRPAPTPAARGVGDVGAVAVPVMPRLQSLQVSAPSGSSALVDGRVVRVGDRLGETVVVSIDAQGILLRGPRYEQRIALVPGGGKTFGTTADKRADTRADTTANTTASKRVSDAASAGSTTILPAPLVARPKPAVVVVPKESQ